MRNSKNTELRKNNFARSFGKNEGISDSSVAGNDEAQQEKRSLQLKAPTVTLPKGGGALKSIDEKFAVNSANGTSSLNVPLGFSQSRDDFAPTVALQYNSGSGNGPFGLGWELSLSAITRKTDDGLPRYEDVSDSDTYIISDAEELVPFKKKVGDAWEIVEDPVVVGVEQYSVRRYRPRIEGEFRRIERWMNVSGKRIHWKVISGENVTHLYGQHDTACIADPDDRTKIFKWLIEKSYDDKGNCIFYQYKKEDLVNVPNSISEQQRREAPAFSNLYLEKILYGCKSPFDPEVSALPEFMFETVFDYNVVRANPQTLNQVAIDSLQSNWSAREDAFSSYRSCFEIRTYRLCHRVLHFHRFAELGTDPMLVRSLDFKYDFDAHGGITFLKELIHAGYKRDGGTYTSKELPPFAFQYSKPGWNTSVKSISPENLVHAPVGLDDKNYFWFDLYNEGLSGILSEQGNSWYYKSNLGDGKFSPAATVIEKPSFSGLNDQKVMLQELEGDGRKFLVSPVEHNGYFEFGESNNWLPFRNFLSMPNIDFKNPNVKFIDLDGDGRADILIDEDNVMCWYASRGTVGFDDYQLVQKHWNENLGPTVLFSDKHQAIITVDINGDGLADIVRVRNSEVVYWPNLGYGNFGRKVVMANSPWLDNLDEFAPENILLADINGSGTADLIYKTSRKVKVFFNFNGNAWSDEKLIGPFPTIEETSSISLIDLLGNGTSCIVWSSPLPAHQQSQIRYIDLMDGKKPFLLTSYENNIGKRVTLQYKASTYYYLKDKQAGNPWITRLPFPVLCVDKVVTEDLEFSEGAERARSRFVQTYAYHHGYFDYPEREFRGFGKVEQWDSEEFDQFKLSSASNVVEEKLHQSPVKVVTWYHTGVYFNKQTVLDHFAGEYFQNDFEIPLADASIDAELSSEEYREAVRACKGMALHVEVYAMDGSPLQDRPYTITSRNCVIKLLQPKGDEDHAVFLVHEGEAIEYHLERGTDPRIAHQLNLEINDIGYVLRSASVVYGRKNTDADLPFDVQQEQSRIRVLFSDFIYTESLDTSSTYRLALEAEESSYELVGPLLSPHSYYTRGALQQEISTATTVSYETSPDGTLQKRLIKSARTFYLSDDLVTPLPFQKLDKLGLPYQKYECALTPGLINNVYQGRLSNVMVSNAKYHAFSGETNWWIPSGIVVYRSSAESVAAAKSRFYQPLAFKDPFGEDTKFTYDIYNFMVMQTEDPLQNSMKVLKMDYRTLRPYSVEDLNLNVNEVLTDELSMVIASSIYGNESDGLKGDAVLQTYVPQSATETADVVNDPGKYLQNASSFYYYDLFAFRDRKQPINFVSITREKHVSAMANGELAKFNLSIQYSSGLGQVLQVKIPAEPGKAWKWQGNTKVEIDTGASLRWVGNGRTIFNNKGNPVKKYEPFFSTAFQYEPEKELVQIGFSATHYYDPRGRLVNKVNADHSLMRVEFDVWKQLDFDENDTILESGWLTNLGAVNLSGPEPSTPDARAAWLAAKHAGTPLQSHFDSLGRIIYIVADNGPGKKYKTRVHLDVEGNEIRVVDAKDNVVMSYNHDMTGAVIHQNSADSGVRWMFNDVAAKPLEVWNARNQKLRFEYDELGRSVKQWLTADVQLGSPEKLINLIVYGENQADDQLKNLRGKIFQTFDQSGKAETPDYDFRGNIKVTLKTLALAFKTVIDWNVPDRSLLLQNETFVSEGKFDALNRPVELTFPDKSKLRHFYNQALLLDRVEMFVARQNKVVEFVKDIEYDAKGQRVRILFGNNTATRYTYYEKTFQLRRILTTRNAGADILQDLNYTYDPAGNITEIIDNAHQPLFFNNASVLPSTKFEYDAVYRLTKAEGREHAGQNAASDQFDSDKSQLLNGDRLTLKGDMNAMQRYLQSYLYDEVGNLLQMIHNAGNGAFINQWTRFFEYNNNDTHRVSNGVNPASVRNNQLLNEWVGAKPSGATPKYLYDPHGNMLNIQKGSFSLAWDFQDNLKEVDLGGGGKAFYVYDSSGQRVRKVVEKGNVTEERIYLGSYETFRKSVNNALTLERESVHVMDNKERIAIVESRITGNDPGMKDLIRYQYSNQIGSAALEVGGDPLNPEIISYEEYYPFGSSSYQAMRSQTETPKRYRYSGKERDEESGLYYHGARYYMPWLVRWISPDPIGIRDGVNVYKYVPDPVRGSDPSGTECSYFDKDGNMYDICVDPEPKPNPILMEERRKWLEKNKPKEVVKVVPKKQDPKPEPKKEPVAEAAPPAEDSDDGTVGKPGFGESLIPIWGSGRESIYHFQKGNYGWGIVHGALAVSDVFLLKSVVTAGGKLLVKGGGVLIGKVAARQEAKALLAKEAAERLAKELAEKEAAELAAKELAKKEAAELAAKEAKALAEKEAAALAAKEAAKVGQIAYGSTDLAKVAVEFRKAEKLKSARNVAVFEYLEGGVKKTIAMASERGAGHSERLIAKELAKRGIDPSKVTRIFSELEPCVAVGGYCKAFISKMFPGAKVTFSFEYGATKASREAGVNALREAIAKIFQ